MKSDLETLIDEASAADSFGQAKHRRIVETLNRVDAQNLSLRERAKGYAHVQDAVMYLSSQSRKVEPEKFPDELSALFKVSAALRYSPALHDWMTQARQTCIRTLKHDSAFQQKMSQWDTTPTHERLALVRDLVGSVMQAHGSSDLVLKTPQVDIDHRITGNGAFTTHADENGHPGSDHIRIHFGAKLLDHENPLPAFVIAYHESVHVITTQLAFAAYTGDIAPAHPLYRDACVNLEKMKAGAVADQSLSDHYHYDCDEELAYFQQDHFLSDFAGITPPSRRVIHAATPTS